MTQVLSRFPQIKRLSAHTPHLGTQGKILEEKLLVRFCGYSANTSTQHPRMKGLRFTCWPQKYKIPLRCQITAGENLVQSYCPPSATVLYTQLYSSMLHATFTTSSSSSSTCQCIKAHGASQHPCKLPQQNNRLISNESISGGGCSLDKPHPRQAMSHPSHICSTSSKWCSRRNIVLLLSKNQMLSNEEHSGCSCRAHRHLAGRYWSQELYVWTTIAWSICRL